VPKGDVLLQRVMIIGSAGSGKSTLSQALGRILDLPVIHLDKYYWKPNWVPTPNDEWDEVVEQLAMKEQWIIDGNYSRTLDIRILRADLIIFMDMPRWLCMYGILKRRVMYHNKTRGDLNEGCPEKIDFEFVKWVWNYRKRSRGKTIEKLEKVKEHKRVIVLRSRKEAADFIAGMKQEALA
jgi:adenylate kinase family enzyme